MNRNQSTQTEFIGASAMFARLTVLLLSLFSLNAGAASYSSLSQNDCTGNLSISLLDIASFSCSGDLFLSGGSITSDAKVVIAAGGLLTLEQFSITAPFVELNSQNTLTIGNNVLLDNGSGPINVSGSLSIAAGTLTVSSGRSLQLGNKGELTVITPVELRPGADISLSAPVPEPSSLMTLLLGLLLVAGFSKRTP